MAGSGTEALTAKPALDELYDARRRSASAQKALERAWERAERARTELEAATERAAAGERAVAEAESRVRSA